MQSRWTLANKKKKKNLSKSERKSLVYCLVQFSLSLMNVWNLLFFYSPINAMMDILVKTGLKIRQTGLKNCEHKYDNAVFNILSLQFHLSALCCVKLNWNSWVFRFLRLFLIEFVIWLLNGKSNYNKHSFSLRNLKKVDFRTKTYDGKMEF